MDFEVVLNSGRNCSGQCQSLQIRSDQKLEEGRKGTDVGGGWSKFKEQKRNCLEAVFDVHHSPQSAT